MIITKFRNVAASNRFVTFYSFSAINQQCPTTRLSWIGLIKSLLPWVYNSTRIYWCPLSSLAQIQWQANNTSPSTIETSKMTLTDVPQQDP